MEAIQVFDRPASRSFYTVAGRFLFVEAVDLRLAPLVGTLFAGWQLTPISPPPRAAEIEIRFFGEQPAVAIPAHLEQFDVAEGGRCYTFKNGYYLQFGNSLLRLRQELTVQVDVWFKQAPKVVDAELARLTSFAVCAGLRRFGLFDLHSAAVAEPESGAGVLIIGPSGSGKSTLTFQLATAGWPYLSDDEVLLSLGAGDVNARGFRSFFALREVAGTSERFAFKNVFEPASVFSTRRVSDVVPRWLLFTSISGEEETRVVELSPPETMTRLIRACPWATYDTSIAGANLDLLSRLARQVKAFVLAAGKDLLEPTRAAELIKQHLRSN
ncbi:MAG TPA: hypothetical protein VHQ94_00045 [Pyrinomonadaceae bacterium]|jgi:hypothetical protein|nr:hypothetical protein [Pyrinomonadaceae bacterium]